MEEHKVFNGIQCFWFPLAINCSYFTVLIMIHDNKMSSSAARLPSQPSVNIVPEKQMAAVSVTYVVKCDDSHVSLASYSCV